MEHLLYLTHRIPYPPNKGDKIRSFHLLKHLTQNHHVHLGTFIDDPEDWQHADAVRGLCREAHFASLHPLAGRLKSLMGFIKREPLTVPYYRSKVLQNWVDRQIAQFNIKHAVIFSSAMAQYVEKKNIHRIVDFVDVDSDKWRQYALSKKFPLSWIYGREGRTLLEYERSLARMFAASVFVSEAEANLFRTLAPESAKNIHFLNNGVDTEYFSLSKIIDNPYQGSAKALVFTGAMDYWANIDAVTWFAQDIFPLILNSVPNAYFYVVGSRPTKEVKELARLKNVIVTGAVPDIRPYVAHATVSVAPLRIARGVQNKVLEAMAMEKAVVATPQAIEGISAEIGQDLIMAQNEEIFSKEVLALIKNAAQAEKIGLSARRRVVADYSWKANLTKIDTLLDAKHSQPRPDTDLKLNSSTKVLGTSDSGTRYE